MRKRKGNTQQIQRIAKYEEMMQEAERLINLHITSEEAYVKLHSLSQELETYYRSDEWKQDFADDEAGRLPKQLKRGVLSEDGIYNLLERFAAEERE